MKTGILTYRESRNLGDALQSIAISRLLAGPIVGVDRTSGKGAERDVRLVANGWLGRNRELTKVSNCVFAGVFVHDDYNFDWIKGCGGRAGARDPATCEALKGRGVEAEVVGCATLTLERARCPRAGVLNVDCVGKEPRRGTAISHIIDRRLPWERQWQMGLELLELYRKAAMVFTSRLHVVLPCLALGTPVYLIDPRRRHHREQKLRDRFSLIPLDLGKDGEVHLTDIDQVARSYYHFLEMNAGVPVSVGEVKMPPDPELS